MTEIIQGSDEWRAVRLGKVTASRVSDVTARTKTGWGSSRANYMGALIAERLTSVEQETYTNAAMIWGIETEAEARMVYEFWLDAEVQQVAFIPHPTIAMSGASPDGLVGDDGMVEIKCPNTATHIETLLGQNVPQKYVAQAQWQMACSGRAWNDFVSYDPRMPESMRAFIKRIPRDDAFIAALEKDVIEFLAELDTKLANLVAIYETRAAA